MAGIVERAAATQFHAGLIVGGLSLHGAEIEYPAQTGSRITLLGKTRMGLPIEITVEVHDAD